MLRAEGGTGPWEPMAGSVGGSLTGGPPGRGGPGGAEGPTGATTSSPRSPPPCAKAGPRPAP
eukprot:3840233-Lingulodinium_polyedra.AAC.1